MKKNLAFIAVLTLVGCASSGVVPVGKDKYMITDSNSLTWEGGSVLVDIVKEGTEYCARQGKQFEILDQKIEDAQSGLWTARRKASATVYFTCK